MNKLKYNNLDYRAKITITFLVVGLLIITYKVRNSHLELTNNAIVECEWSDVNSEISGVITSIGFIDDQAVSAGSILFTLDDSDKLNSLENAKNELDIKKSEMRDIEIKLESEELELKNGINTKNRDIEVKNKQIISKKLSVTSLDKKLESESLLMERYKSEVSRHKVLRSAGSVSNKQYQDKLSQYNVQFAYIESIKIDMESLLIEIDAELINLEKLKEQNENKIISYDVSLNRIKNEIKLASFNIVAAKNKLEAAEIEYGKTTIIAQRSGKVTNRKLSSGQYVNGGQPLASIVSCQSEFWVEANFKETQIYNMRVGQDVEIAIDAYSNETFSGTVMSISNGTGTTFSVIPPENATGNFTKVVKRFPVKISFKNSQSIPMRIGMSASVTVDTSI